MKPKEPSYTSSSTGGIDGAILAFSPLPFLFLPETEKAFFPGFVYVAMASLASVACGVWALTLYSKTHAGKPAGLIALAGFIFVALPGFIASPFAALIGAVALIAAVFYIFDRKNQVTTAHLRPDPVIRRLQRARGAAYALFITFIITSLITATPSRISDSVLLSSFGIFLLLFTLWTLLPRLKWQILLPVAATSAVAYLYLQSGAAPGSAILIFCGTGYLMLQRPGTTAQQHDRWWMMLINHPARLMLTTFLGLSIFGTLLLSIPDATVAGSISPVDAAFTAISAVCTSGLIVLDTPKAFSVTGQLIIMILIQLGGLGIMTITTVALHVIGRRISLKQEHLLISITDTDHKDLLNSLIRILLFTLAAEGTGAAFLAALFHSAGETTVQAIWSGAFTSVSAFCNAGFALQSDSLISYAENPGVLHITALLIIAGGMAPATCMLLPRWLAGKQIPVSAHLALVMTVVLLFSGTLLFLSFEWNGLLAGLSFGDKLHNAWFQSVTLRAAGFNSVPMENISTPGCLFMMLFMLVGGSPGGTAGGIKTTTFGVLVITFWATIANRRNILLCNRTVTAETIYKAIAITASFCIIWALAVIMLEVTQQIATRDIVFEVSSALGTTGLSIGATQMLDEIGKLIIMTVIFIGRIGPMTLFMLLSNDRSPRVTRCPDAKISLV